MSTETKTQIWFTCDRCKKSEPSSSERLRPSGWFFLYIGMSELDGSYVKPTESDFCSEMCARKYFDKYIDLIKPKGEFHDNTKKNSS